MVDVILRPLKCVIVAGEHITKDVARPYATLGTGIYSAPEVLSAPGPDAGAARVVTTGNLGINYGFGVDFPLGARSSLGVDFRIHSFVSEPYNPRDMFNITLGLGMNLGG